MWGLWTDLFYLTCIFKFHVQQGLNHFYWWIISFYMDVSLFYLFISFWTFGFLPCSLLWIMLLWIFMHTHFCGHLIYLGYIAWDRNAVSDYNSFALGWTATVFSNNPGPIYFSTHKLWEFYFSTFPMCFNCSFANDHDVEPYCDFDLYFSKN